MDSPCSSLVAYGWDEGFAAAFVPHERSGLIPARVVRVDRGWCDVVASDGPARASAAAVASPDPAAAVCVGDWAALRPGPQPELRALLPRRTAITRAAVGRSSHAQVLAANVDTVAVVLPAGGSLDAGRAERLLALAWESGARPVLVLTKVDLAVDVAATRAQAGAVAAGVDIALVSAVTGAGLSELRTLLSGTSVLLGPSGAGKSTLANALLGADLLAVNEVRASDGKGRHTTVRRELLPMPGGGVLIDTPGLRRVGLFDAADGLAAVFDEIQQLAAACRFVDCRHEREPDCAVLAAVESGELPARRLDSYRRLLRESAWAAARADARLRAERANEHKAIVRAQRALYRSRGRDQDPRRR